MKNLIRYFSLAAFVALGVGCAKTEPSTTTSAKGNLARNTAPASTPIVTNADLHPADEHDAPRISLEDAKKDFDENAAVFIDTHPPNQYEFEHIPGAINIQPNVIKQSLDKVPKDKKIIVYCACGSEHSSASLVSELHKAGIKNSFALLGGTRAWRDAGYPMEKKQQ
ncbi:MAG: rhodanese-like domain-containing protein [Pyrinomonadaceae bacterium]